MPLSMATSQIQMEKWLGMPVRAFKQAFKSVFNIRDNFEK